MFAFSAPLSLGVRTVGLRPSYTCARWRASADNSASDFGSAVDSGAALRKQLREVEQSRKAQAERTSQALDVMNEQLSLIMAKLRADAGMPPVAKPAKAQGAVAVDGKREGTKEDAGTANASYESGLDSGSDEPYMDPSNFGFDSTAGWQVLAAADDLPENEQGNVEFRIQCDMNGCSIIEIKEDSPPGPGVRQKYVQSGPGFRVGYDPEAPKSFCGMVGNDQWLLALSYDEIRHFKRLCLSLRKKMDRIGRGEEDPPVKKPAVRRSGDGMFNERVARAGLDCSVELESKLVWVQAIGQPTPGQYCIRAIFMEGRQSEGFWASSIVPDMLSAVARIGVE